MTAESIIEHIEEQIQQWIRDTFKRNVGVSIQTLYSYQGIDRPQPTNSICRSSYNNSGLRIKCDMSDQLVKLYADKEKIPIAYRCHKGLTNVVIPYYDSDITINKWFIFIGQFTIKPVFKCSGCKSLGDFCEAHKSLLEQQDIHILSTKDMSNIEYKYSSDYIDTVKSDVFATSELMLDISQQHIVEIFQLLLCVTKAKNIFKEKFEIAKTDKMICQLLNDYIAKYSELPKEFPKLENKNSSKDINKSRYHGTTPDDPMADI